MVEYRRYCEQDPVSKEDVEAHLGSLSKNPSVRVLCGDGTEVQFHNRHQDKDEGGSRHVMHVAALGADGLLQVFAKEVITYVGDARTERNEDTEQIEPVRQVISKRVARVFAPTHWREVVAEEWGSWTEKTSVEYIFKQ